MLEKSCGIGSNSAVTLTRTLSETQDTLDETMAIVRDLHTKLRGPEPSSPEENCKMLQRETGILELAEQNNRKAEVLRGELAGILARL